MVRIVNYNKKQSENGKEFFTLEVTGGVEMVLSKSTGQYYATVRRAFIASTFDEEACKALLGSDLPGGIIKMPCDPYEYIIKETGEITMLAHRFVYQPDMNQPSTPMLYGKVEADVKTFSMNELESQPV